MILEDLDADQLRELLAVYMAHVIDVESVSFMDDGGMGYELELTETQVRHLRRAERSVLHMQTVRDPRLPWRR